MTSPSRLAARARAACHLGRAIVCNRLGRVTWPSLVHLYVTWRCNLRCRTCSVWRENRYPEIGTEGMLRVIDELRCLDVVKMTGGEPFLREDLETLVEAVQARIRPAMLHIVSNGTFPERMEGLARRLGNSSLHIRISLEGGEAVHNAQRGQPWAFERTFEALERLRLARRSRGFHLGVNYHLCQETLADLPRFVSYCREHRIDLVPGVATYPFLEDRYEDVQAHERTEAERAQLRERFDQVWSMKGDLSAWEAGVARRLALRAVHETLDGSLAFKCRELRNLIYVLPDGNVVTCGLKHRPIGNLARERLADLWFGERIEAFRRDVDACPGCRQDSVRMTSRLYCGDLFRTSPGSSGSASAAPCPG